MAKAKKELTPEEVAAKAGEDKVDVWENDHFVRTFSLEVHGEKFLELANEFVGKKAGRSLK